MRGRVSKFTADDRAEKLAWWDKHVRKRGGKRGRPGIPMREAERIVGVTQATISRWRRRGK